MGGTFDREAEEEIARIKRSAVLVKRMNNVQYLIIDEVSMMSTSKFDKLNRILRDVRNNPKPFGGVKVVMCGDPFQLPPVEKKEEIKPEYVGKTYFFESDNFDNLINKVVYLDQIFRQEGDTVFKAILNEARFGQLSDKAVQIIEKRIGFNLNCPKWIKCTSIYPYKKDADECNTKELNELPGEVKVYRKIEKYTRNIGKEHGEKLLTVLRRSCNAPEAVELKLGSTVILTVNASTQQNLANGSQGKIVGFIDWDDADFGVIEVIFCILRLI
jgi:ATP-dependent DNA helicase PIF1